MKVWEMEEGKRYEFIYHDITYNTGCVSINHIEFVIKHDCLYEITDDKNGTEDVNLSRMTFNEIANSEFMEVKRTKKVGYYEALEWMHKNLRKKAMFNGEGFFAYRTLGLVLIGKDENGSFNKYDATKEMINGVWEIPID